MARPFTRLSDSFKILRDNLNTVSYNVGDPDDLTTTGDSDVVQAINEIERVFDASTGEFLYPTGSSVETNSRILISTNQNSGDNIHLDAGEDIIAQAARNFFVDVTEDITLDAGGSNIYFKDDSATRFTWNLDATPSLDATGDFDIVASAHFKVDAADEIFLDTNIGTVKMQKGGADAVTFSLSGGTQTQQVTGNYTTTTSGNYLLDATGDITLDADGADIFFKDGGTTRFQYNLGATNTITTTGDLDHNVSGAYTLDAGGAIEMDATGAFRIQDAGTDRFAYTLGASNTLDVSGNLTQTISGNASDSADGTYHIGATGNTDITTRGTFNTSSLAQTHTVDGDFFVDGTGDVILDAAGGQIDFKDGTSLRIRHNLGATNEIDVTGNLTYDVSGDIVLDADGGNVTFKDGGTTDYNFATDGTVSRTGDIAIDVSGNITLDADGGNWYFKDGGTTDYQFATDGTVSRTGDLTLDISGDIVLDADGGNIDLKDGGTARFAYGLGTANTLDVTGSLAETVSSTYTMDVSGDHTDSADGIRTINASDGFTVYTNSAVSITGDGNTTIAAGGNALIDAEGNFTVDAEGDIVLDANGADIDFKDAGTTRFAYGMGATNTLDVTGNLDRTVSGNYSDSANGTYSITSTGNMSSTTLGTLTTTSLGQTHNATGNFVVDASGDIDLDADGAQIRFKDGGTNRFVHNLGAINEIDVTGHLVYDVSKTMTFDAGGSKFVFNGGNANDSAELKFNSSNQFELQVPADFYLDAQTDITLDANGNDIFLRSTNTVWGKMTNASGDFVLYGAGQNDAANKQFTLRNNNISVHNALSLDSALGTSDQTVAGSLNEIHTELDSASGEIETVKNTIENMLKVFDSGGTSANISGTGISTLNTLDKTFVGGINEIDTRLDSAVSEINVAKGNIRTNDTDIQNLDDRIGLLSDLDSASTRSFFDSDGTNGSIIKALNELARRAVAIYDESGTLLN